jgi:hypothetical protein
MRLGLKNNQTTTSNESIRSKKFGESTVWFLDGDTKPTEDDPLEQFLIGQSYNPWSQKKGNFILKPRNHLHYHNLVRVSNGICWLFL